MMISQQLAAARTAYFQAPPSEMPQAASSDAAPSFRDVLDALNPLNHIPVLSDLSAAEESSPSPLTQAASVVFGTLLGGPLGLVTSLASAAFESATGETPIRAVAEAAMPQTAPQTPVAVVEKVEVKAFPPLAQAPRHPVLELYGESAPSAHASYRSAQLRPYLTDVTVSKVL